MKDNENLEPMNYVRKVMKDSNNCNSDDESQSDDVKRVDKENQFHRKMEMWINYLDKQTLCNSTELNKNNWWEKENVDFITKDNFMLDLITTLSFNNAFKKIIGA